MKKYRGEKFLGKSVKDGYIKDGYRGHCWRKPLLLYWIWLPESHLEGGE
jgi:hypothetical protein